MSSELPSGKGNLSRVDDFGLGPYDSENSTRLDSDVDDPQYSLPSPGEPERTYDFFASSRLPEDNDLPVARADYYDSLYVGQKSEAVENLEIQDNGFFGYNVEDLSDNAPPRDPYEAGVLSSIISTLFESSDWESEPRIRACASDIHAAVRMLRRHF